MKTIITLLVITVLFTTSLHAQYINETPRINNRRTGFGAFVGLNHSYPIVDIGQPIHVKPQENFIVGVDMRYTINKRTSLHLQPTWVQNQRTQGEADYVNYNLTSLKLPLLIRYFIPDQKLFFIQAGASYNYLVNSSFSEQVDIECLVAPCPVFYSVANPTSKSAVSAVAGLGFNIELQKVSIPIVLQYERSISSYNFQTSDSFWGNTGQNIPLTFHNVSLTTGISF